MKGYFRSFFITAFAFWVVLEVIPSVNLKGDWQTFILVSAAIFVASVFIKPVIKLIFLPFNLLTFNLLSVLITAAVLFFLSFIVPQLRIDSFNFQGINYNGIVIPPVEVNQLSTLFAAAIIITVISATLNWISS